MVYNIVVNEILASKSKEQLSDRQLMGIDYNANLYVFLTAEDVNMTFVYDNYDNLVQFFKTNSLLIYDKLCLISYDLIVSKMHSATGSLEGSQIVCKDKFLNNIIKCLWYAFFISYNTLKDDTCDLMDVLKLFVVTLDMQYSGNSKYGVYVDKSTIHIKCGNVVMHSASCVLGENFLISDIVAFVVSLLNIVFVCDFNDRELFVKKPKELNNTKVREDVFIAVVGMPIEVTRNQRCKYEQLLKESIAVRRGDPTKVVSEVKACCCVLVMSRIFDWFCCCCK